MVYHSQDRRRRPVTGESLNRGLAADSADTIAAIATPPGRGGIGVVRISGSLAPAIAVATLGRLPFPRQAEIRDFLTADGDVIDRGIALYFSAPASFTGEDVVELQGHGGSAVLDRLLARAIELGARLAAPGEFTRRAFLNDKIDLTQAEAVADLIDAASTEAAAAAIRSLQGRFSERIEQLVEAITLLRAYVEAAIDFPDDEIDFLADGAVTARLDDLDAQFVAIASAARQGCLMSEGMDIVIAGRPNVGKSSLLNVLSERETAIVTDIAGTTRDVVTERIQIDGMPLNIVDTAGLREARDPVEQEGVRRARAAMRRADRVLLVIDDRDGVACAERDRDELLPTDCAVTAIGNKCDLSVAAPALIACGSMTYVRLCARTGEGIDLLRQHLKECMGYHDGNSDNFSARRRHLDALQRGAEAVRRGREQLTRLGAGELLAEDLREAQQALGEITGVVTSDDLLGRIFSTFCIGK